MDLGSFRAGYERWVAGEAAHGPGPDRVMQLVKDAAQLDVSCSERVAIEAYVAECARQGNAQAVEHLSCFGADRHLPLLWSLTQSDCATMRLASADALCVAGHVAAACSVLAELVPLACGRDPEVSSGRLIDAVARLPDEAARDLLWSLTRVSNSSYRSSALHHAFQATLQGRGEHGVHVASMRSWACLPLDAIRSAVRRDLEASRSGVSWTLPGPGDKRPPQVHKVIMCIMRGTMLPEVLPELSDRSRNDVLFWVVKFMAYFFDPLDEFGGTWRHPWPVGGPRVVQTLGPTWAEAVLAELLEHARRRGAHVHAAELRSALDMPGG